jgi:hypothetical protein
MSRFGNPVFSVRETGFEWQFAIWAYLLFSLCNAAFAVLWADGRPLHAINAALFATGAVVFIQKGRRLP